MRIAILSRRDAVATQLASCNYDFGIGQNAVAHQNGKLYCTKYIY
jgi:hypothetical protein